MTDDILLAEARTWAADVLGVAPNATEREVRQAVFAKLPERKFWPDLQLMQAATVLLSPRVPLKPGKLVVFEQAHEESLRKQIAQFADEYFQLTPESRRQRYSELQKRTAKLPQLAFRMAQFGPALNVQLPSVAADADVKNCLRWCGELAVLSPRERAIRRRAVLTQAAEDPSRWPRTAKELQKSFPAVAALAPDLLTALIELPRGEWRRLDHRRTVQKGVAQSNTRSQTAVVVIVVLMLSGLLRGVTSQNRNQRGPRIRQQQQQSQPSAFPSNIDTHLENLAEREGLEDLEMIFGLQVAATDVGWEGWQMTEPPEDEQARLVFELMHVHRDMVAFAFPLRVKQPNDDQTRERLSNDYQRIKDRLKQVAIERGTYQPPMDVNSNGGSEPPDNSLFDSPAERSP